MKKFRRHCRFRKHFVLAVQDALNLACKLLPDYRHALALLGIQRPPHAMLKSAAGVALSNNSKKFEISREKRGRKMDACSVVAFRE
jgi:hypothetical protein